MDNQLIFITILFLVLILQFFFVNGRENFSFSNCTSKKDETTCRADNNCNWDGARCNNNFVLIRSCLDNKDKTTCNADMNCSWDSNSNLCNEKIASCLDNINETTCKANTNCKWEPATPQGDAACFKK